MEMNFRGQGRTLLLLVCILTSLQVHGQITGTNPVIVGTTATYTYDDGNLYNRRAWTVTNGTINSTSYSGTSNSCSVTWSSTCGTGVLTFKNLTTVISTLNVTINPTLATPTGTFTTTQYCRYTTLTRNGTPPTGETWYWQTSASGTSTSNSGSTYNITAAGYYYLRAYACGGWSTNSLSTGHIGGPIDPATPTGTNGSRCGSGTVGISAAPGSQGDNIRWYAAASGGTALATGTSFTTPSISSTTVYYAASLHTATNCESLTRTAVTATVNPVPTVAASGQAICAGQTTSISISNPNGVSGTAFNWIVSSSGITGASDGTGSVIAQTLSVSSGSEGTATYTITPTAGSCSGTPVNAAVTVTKVPQLSTSGPNPMIMGKVTQLSTTTSYYSYQWKKDNADISGATAQQYTLAGPAGYKVSVKSSSGSATCVSTETAVTAAIVNQGTNVNTVITTTVFKEGVTGTTSLYTLAPGEYTQNSAFADGLGRVFQTVSQGAGPKHEDLVSHVAYGKHGLVDKTYLPFAIAGADGRLQRYAILPASGGYTSSTQYSFYQHADTSKVASDANPYVASAYSLSPDAHVIEQGAPGQTWQPGSTHTVRTTATVNTTTYPVKYWKADGTTNGNYPSKSVFVSITTDENGNQVRTYTNKLGQTVLKQVQLDETIGGQMTNWLETYYIYDDFGNLTYQVPPKAMNVLGNGPNLDAKSTSIADLVYIYSYDTLGRLVEKKEPGAVVKYLVYDKYDRLVLTQDGALRAQGRWAYVKYDAYGRTAFTGIYSNNRSRSSVQKWAAKAYTASSSSYPDTNFAEYKQSGVDSLLGYSNVSFPKDSIFRLAASYYDSYDFNPNQTPPFAYDRTHLTGLPTKASSKVRGMATGSRVRLLSITGNVTANWLKSAVFYDTYDRVIQTQSNNHLDLSAVDKSSVLYNTIRRVARTKLTHTAQAVTTNITQWNVYDHAGRVQKTYHKINSNDSVLVAQYDYNALGQVVDKKLHKTGATSFLQSVDYRYNIRGWLTSINNDKLMSDNGITNDDTYDYFGLEMMYEKTDTLGGSQFFNGNVSAIKWKGPGKAGYGNRRSYKFAYDKSDKLKAATFQAHAGSAAANWSKEANTLNEVLTYDHNGNILTLDRKRNARTLGGSDVASSVDYLTYGYATNSNLLMSVQDTDTAGGFKNLANTGSEYAHNSDGSITRDDNKGISSITYNMLGKPQVVTFTNGQKVEYVYDASGTKLTVKTWQGATLKSVTNTAGGLVYEGSTPALSYFSSPEGRVVRNGANFEYQYAIADHQGNTRVVFTSAPAAPQSYFADMEAGTNTNFNNYTSRVNFDLMDHTDSVYDQTDYSQKLYGNSGSQVGVAKSFKVYPGDKVSIRAFAKYYDPETTTSNLSGFASALVSAYGVTPPGSGEAANAWSALNNYGAVAAGGGGHANSSGSYPKAYVNLIAFDKKYNFLDGAWNQINGGRQLGSTPTAHDEMYQEYVAREEGYVYVFVSNENPTLVEVYFDDVTVTITPGNVIQANEYYAFGHRTPQSWNRSNNGKNGYLYNSKELEDQLGLYDYGPRRYDAVLGRWDKPDELADRYPNASPYAYVVNNPVNAIDPSGQLIVYVSGFRVQDYVQYLGNAMQSTRVGIGQSSYSMPPWIHDQRIFDHDTYSYWGNVDDHFDNLLKTVEGEQSVYMDGMYGPFSGGQSRFERGYSEGMSFSDNISSRLSKNETVKIVGHSQGAAHAAGLALGLLEKGIDVELAFYLAPHQPDEFATPRSIYSFQFMARSDKVSSDGGLAWLLGSTFERVEFTDVFIEMLSTGEGAGGHMVETFQGPAGIAQFMRTYGDLWRLLLEGDAEKENQNDN